MPTLTIQYETEEERAAIEQALAFVAEMRQLALTAQPGQVLDSCEDLALDAGRKLLRDTIQNAAQTRIDAEEKKNAAARLCSCSRRHYFKGRHGRHLMTALGDIQIRRCFASCPHCHLTCFPADSLLGIDGWMTRHALQMAVRVGIHEPFRKAEGLLADLLGWSVDADTLRRRCHEQAHLAAAKRAERTALPEAFSQAGGSAELHLDAGKFFGTDKQWHDIKLGVLLVRPPGQPSDPTQFAQRGLPSPVVRSVVAGVETRQEFGPRVAAEAGRLKLPTGAGLSVLGDGAEWIWNLAGEHFPQARQVLDFWHGAEHLASAGRLCFSAAVELSEWLSRAKVSLASDGYSGVCLSLLEASKGEPLGEGLVKELNYFAGHQGRMNYALRLHRGESIGSGAVEGAIKQLVNLRVKRTAARWDAKRVGDFVQLLAQADTAEWHEYWASLAV